MRKACFVFIVILSVLLLNFTPIPPVFAQEEDTFTLEEITVTAEKREVNVQDTAISITAISGADIREKAQVTLDSVLRDVAGVQVGGFSAGMQVFIRGVGSNVDSEVTDPSNALMVDGVYSERSESVMGALYDISRVEVLRGPQGTLYGRNAVGGTINMISNAPTDKFEANANFNIGDYNLKHVDGALNVPMTEKVASRFAFLRETRDGYISNGQMDSDKLSFRAKVSYDASENISFLATYERNEDYSNSMATVPVPGSAGNLPAMMVGDEVAATGWELPIGADDWDNDEYHERGKYDIISDTYTVQMDLDLGWSQLTMFPSYTETDRSVFGDMMLGTLNTMQTETNELHGELWSGEARLASPAESDFQWLVGLYYLTSENTRASDADPNAEMTDTDGAWSSTTYTQPSDTTAIFGQATYPLTDRFRLTAGLRFSLDDKSMKYRYYNTDVPVDSEYYELATVMADGTRVYDSGVLTYDDSFHEPTYKIGLEYDLNEDSMLYVQRATGFKSGGLNQDVPPTVFDPEELVAYEIGSKNRFFDNRLQLNAEAFYYDYDNMQVRIAQQVITVDGEGGFAMNVVNADKGTNVGAEIEADYLMTPDDRVKVSVAYLDATYGKITLPASMFTGDPEFPLEDTEVANSPDWVETFTYQHTWNLDEGEQITASVNTKLSSGYWTTIEKNNDGAWQDSYTRSDANVTYRTADAKWSATLWIKNIENDAQTTFVMPFYRRVVTAPRTVGMNISFRY